MIGPKLKLFDLRTWADVIPSEIKASTICPPSRISAGACSVPSVPMANDASMCSTPLLITSKAVRQSNNFNFEPIKEVAYLFIGIFTCMIPALMLLNARGGELGLSTPASYFWATGLLSSFLDNAPTYLTFLATAMGSMGITHAVDMTTHPEGVLVLEAISAGAVFMGAMTYIGNGPNFMVKAIAEGSGIRMPSFFGYLAYSLVVLFPVFVLVTLVFF